MKRNVIILCSLFMFVFLNSQELVDIGGKQTFTIGTMKKNETFFYTKKGTKEGFELDLIARADNGDERILAKIAHFSGYQKLCNNEHFYFSIDNHYHRKTNPDLVAELFVLDIKNGVIQKVLDSLAFSASDDGLFICYCEVNQQRVKEQHEILYWYLYNTKTKENKVIIDKKQKNNWDVFPPIYDSNSRKFVFEIGYDTVVKEKLEIDPYRIK